MSATPYESHLGRNSQGVAVVGDSVKIVPASHIDIRLSVTLSVSSFAAEEVTPAITFSLKAETD